MDYIFMYSFVDLGELITEQTSLLAPDNEG